MPSIHVCPLSRISMTVAETDASHLISLINDTTAVERPASIPPERHLFLGMNDIVEPMDGLVLPDDSHVRELLDFVGDWDRTRPMVVHCFAGISRSTAAAFITICALKPERDEFAIAQAFRKASVYAYPNRRLVTLADTLLEREGRMVAAVEAIGPGVVAAESVPFGLAVEG
jgi:predicted protein tyrosine phosphatase